MNTLRFWLMAVALAVSFVGYSAAQTLPDKGPDKSLGVLTCASSLCHGSIAAWNGSPVLQNEYVVWSRLDKHAGAYKLLSNSLSKKMASKLSLPSPAHESKVCLDCHAHNPVQSAPEHHTSDGVSCEACHGGAERWIGTHTEPGNSHAKNLAKGMYPSAQPEARAKLCLSCHSGNADKYVTHRMMAAGHPRLSFEANTFTSLQPAHFKVDVDYVQRKGSVVGANIWAVGQAVAVVAQIDILMDPKRGRDGLFPELTLFDCHSCHHPMTDQRWAPKTTLGANQGPGLVRLNDSNMLMLYLILQQTSPVDALSFKAAVEKLNQAVAGTGDLLVAAIALKRQAQSAVQKLSQHTISNDQLLQMAVSLTDGGLKDNYSDYAGAEQATMALGTVVSVLNQNGKIGSAMEINSGLAKLRASLLNDEKFKPTDFGIHLKAFKSQLLSGLTKIPTSTERRTP